MFPVECGWLENTIVAPFPPAQLSTDDKVLLKGLGWSRERWAAGLQQTVHSKVFRKASGTARFTILKRLEKLTPITQFLRSPYTKNSVTPATVSPSELNDIDTALELTSRNTLESNQQCNSTCCVECD
ncbi:hypothetical protein BaRGS_00012581 [Batillaria attramentaria]|uniref:Uncharacterized protein n=1 Tax=Batillaria attramentaria TaxID=370345 RepID=A0ABD0LA51_9CAEN